MIVAALDRVFREASGRIVAALASRFRNLALAEDAFSEACTRALEAWPATEVPRDPAADAGRTRLDDPQTGRVGHLSNSRVRSIECRERSPCRYQCLLELRVRE
jgi:predicted RNA polymerase sigma factor